MEGFEIPLEGGYVGDAQDRFGLAEQQISPLIFDLDSDGLDLIALADSTAFFDLDNDGFVERVGWVDPDDALLVRDLDANGFIETRNELFGGSPSDGFASLRLLDSNADNVIDASDAAFADLKVWRDLNGNGVSEDGELQSLTAAGIASISLASTHLTTPQTIAGNSVTDTSSFTWTAGGTGLIADVWFTVNQAFSFDARPVEIALEALFLPTLRGYGIISSLTAQMSRDATLLDLVQDFVETPLSAVTGAQIRDIMYRWAEVQDVDPTSRGAHIDARQLAFLEKFLDDTFVQFPTESVHNPGDVAARDLIAAFDIIEQAVTARLVAQAQLSEIVGIGAFDYLGDTFAGVDLQAALGLAGAAAALVDGDSATLNWWRFAFPLFDEIAQTQLVPPADCDAWLRQATGASVGYALTSREIDYSTVSGTAGSESVAGTTSSEFVVGGAGNDSLAGNSGNDLYLFAPGHGHDRILESNGTDAIVFTTGIAPGDVTAARAGDGGMDLLLTFAGAPGDSLIVTDYFDLYQAYRGVEEIRFADGTMWTYAATLARALAPTSGNDTINGDVGPNTIDGADGDDSLNGDTGDDTITGGAGNDTIDGSRSNDSLLGGAGNDSIMGFASDGGHDTLDGGAGNDTLLGGPGDDLYIFRLGEGHDSISEGGGVDAIVFASGIAPANVTAARASPSSNDLLLTFAGAASDSIRVRGYFDPNNSFYDVEEIRFSDGTVWDHTALALAFTPTAGNDTLAGDDAANVITGDAGNDTIDGRGGNDSLYGGAGGDRLVGGLGNDVFFVDAATDSVVELVGEGVDEVHATASSFTLGGNVERLVYVGTGTFAGTGSGSTESIIGGAGADTLRGYGGADTLDGGSGDDRLEGGSGSDLHRGGAGRDVALFEAASGAVTISLMTGVGTGAEAAGDTFSDIEDLAGSGYADHLSGSADANHLAGGSGNDTLIGNAGADTLAGGAGSDSVVGGDGDDYISFADSTVGVTLNLTAGTASGDGVDTISQVEHALGSSFADSLFGSPAGNYLDGAAGNDSIRGNGANDTLVGGVGDDILQGGGGLDLMLGGTGRDLVTYNAETDGVTVNLTTGQASRASGAEDTIQDVEDLRGTNANDSLVGTAGANEIEGVNGDDTLVGLGGADTFWGGNGVDYVVFASASSGVLVNLATNISGGAAAGSRFSLIEGVVGSAFGDTIVGSSVDNVVQGGAGADSLDGGAGFDWLDYATSTAAITVNLATAAAIGGDAQGDTIMGFEAVIGAALNDALTGSADANVLHAGAGNDVLAGSSGADTLLGDGGVDQLNGGADADYLDGGADVDWAMYSTATAGVHVNLALGTGLAGEALGDVLINIEQIVGSASSDTLIGDAGDNALRANAGGDSLDGGAGIDLLDYSTSAAGVTVNLATGSTSGGDAQGDTIANFENVGGGSAADALTGNGDANVLQGNGGNDTLVGGGGDDTLNGTAGTDRLTGGTGADRFRWTLSTDTGLDSTADVVTDFLSSDADRIDLSFIDPNSALAGNQAFSFIGTAAFASGTRGQLRYENSGGNTWIQADLDGNQVAEFEIMLVGNKTLTASDFLL